MKRGFILSSFYFASFVELSQGGSLQVVKFSDRGAVCLDGSDAGFYFGAATSNEHKDDWQIHFKGGGWCAGPEDCLARSRGRLGSSNSWGGTTLASNGIASRDCVINPDFCKFNYVEVEYCDGDSFLGDRAEPVLVGPPGKEDRLYFRGARIVESMVDKLVAKYGLQRAKNVLITGCSAGGLAAILNADVIYDLLRQHGATPQRYKVVSCSGFFPLLPNFLGQTVYGDLIKDLFELSNATTRTRCFQDLAGSDIAWHCNVAQYALSYIQAPIFLVNSAKDSWVSRCTFRALQHRGQDIQAACSAKARPGLTEHYNQFRKLILTNPTVNRPGNGAFVHTCDTHCEGAQPFFNKISLNRVTIQQAISRWWNSINEIAAAHTYAPCSDAQKDCEATCSRAPKHAARPPIDIASSTSNNAAAAADDDDDDDKWSESNSNNNNNNINSNNSSSRDVAAPLPPPASQPMLGGSKSTPTLGRSAEEARRALAEATEDHDHAAMRLALESARSAGLASSELQGAQRILTFEAQRQLWDGMQALTKESEELRSLVQTATTKASLLESTRSIPPQEVDLNSVWSEAWLDKVAEKVEERIWKKFESRMADFTAKLLESTDQRLQRSLEEFRQACSELETVCLAETKVDFTPVTASVQESPQFSPETASLRRLSWGSSIPSARVNAGAPEASAEVDEAADSESDDEGIMRWALALAVKTGAHRNTNPPTPPPTTSKPAVDRDEVVSMSTMDTEGRSLGLLNSYADQPTPRFTPRTSPEGDAPSNAQPSARSVTSTASSPRQRLTIANSPREELVGLLHWKLDHQGTDRGSLGKDEMGLLAMMCGFVGSGERWDLEWQSLKGLHGWTDQRGVDAASLSKYLERQRVGMEELQCMCKGLNYVRGQTAIPKSEGPPQVVSLRYNYSNVEVPKE